MNADITDILNEWTFDPEDQYRVIEADDGRQVLQVRQPLGIEQYELDGRPDGKRPFGKDSVLTELNDRLTYHRAFFGENSSFGISHDDFLHLQNEGILFYYRYLILFQVGDYPRTVQDTSHNLQICELVENYAEIDDDKKEILQYRPYVLRMFAISKAMICLGENQNAQARRIIESAIETIRTIDEIDTPTFKFERIRSLQYLRSALKQIKAGTAESNQKVDPVIELRRELDEAVENEDYERAAKIRDRIREMSNLDRS